MREEIYNFYSRLSSDEKSSKEYVLICTFKKTRELCPIVTLEEFEEMIHEFTKRYYEESKRK